MTWYKSASEFKEQNGYTIDDVWYPRVTAIVSIKAKPALYAFYASMPNFKAAEAMKNKSADEGTLIHDTIEAILKNEKVEIPENIKPAISAFLDFKSRNDIVVHKVEERILSKKHGYSGTMDVLAEVNGHLGVLDIKTSMAIYRDYNMQTSAYVEALVENADIPPLSRWILRIDQNKKCVRCGASLRSKGGRDKIRGDKYPCEHEWSEMRGEYEFKELPNFDHDIKAFLACKTLWEWEHDYWLRHV